MWRHMDVVDVQVEVLALRSEGEREWEAMEETRGGWCSWGRWRWRW